MLIGVDSKSKRKNHSNFLNNFFNCLSLGIVYIKLIEGLPLDFEKNPKYRYLSHCMAFNLYERNFTYIFGDLENILLLSDITFYMTSYSGNFGFYYDGYYGILILGLTDASYKCYISTLLNVPSEIEEYDSELFKEIFEEDGLAPNPKMVQLVKDNYLFGW